MKRLSFFVIGLCMTVSVCAQNNDRPDVNYDESKIPPYSLPEALKTQGGQTITSAAQWESLRRPEVLRLFEDEMYGRMPEGEFKEEFKVVNVDEKAVFGKATYKEVEITLSRGGQSRKATIHVYTPNHIAKAPMFMYFSGNNQPTGWLIKLIDAGFGLCTGDNSEFFPDRQNDPTVYGESLLSLWGVKSESDMKGDYARALAVWAWGHSRALDYLETDPRVDAGRVVVMGHSRGGKLAAWAAATDQRFAIAILNNSGCGGAALFRRKFGENAYRINLSFPYWLCGNFHKYSFHEDDIPVDQHELIDLIAPRPVYVASGVQDQWADPKGEFLSVAHAEEVYNLYGYKGVQTFEQPELNAPIGDRAAYHIRSGGHAVTDYDWDQYIRFATKWLK